jgi:integrase
MPRKNLTEQGVAKLKPPTDRQFQNYHDGIQPGLVLRVSAKGRKTWVAQYYAKSVDQDGNRTTIPTSKALGLYPTLKVKEAREAARAFLVDPLKAKAQADTGSFREVAENFVRRHVDKEKLRTKDDIVRLLNTHIYPHWANRTFREIRRSDVADLLDKIEDNSGPRQADVCLAIIRKMMNWYATRNDDYSTPIVKGMGRYSAKDHKGDRFLSDDEIRALWKACDEIGTFGALVKTLLLTGQRRDKVATRKWDDIVDGEWRIASEAREKTNAGTLKLPQPVLDIINAQPRIAQNPYVFAGRGHGQFNSFSQRTEELNAKLPDMPPWVLHDLRRTCRKLMSKAGVRPDVAELALGHSIKGIQATYDDPEAYRPMIGEALQSVADRIERIINPSPDDNVADLAQARANRKASRRSRRKVSLDAHPK